MRLALIPDIHGNSLALNAVLNDVERRGEVEGYVFTGDYCALGHDPAGVLKCIMQLPDTVFIRGNMDRYTVRLEDQKPQPSQAEANPAIVQVTVNVARSMSWTLGAVSALGYYEWMRDLPLEHRLTLPNGTRVLFVHAAPNTDDGPGIRRDHSDKELEEILVGCEADLVITGHTHVPLDKTVNGIRIVNLGSISNPHMPDLRAWYALLNADEQGYSLEQLQVEYDYEALVKAIQASSHPTPEFIMSFYQLKQLSDIFADKQMIKDQHKYDGVSDVI